MLEGSSAQFYPVFYSDMQVDCSETPIILSARTKINFFNCLTRALVDLRAFKYLILVFLKHFRSFPLKFLKAVY